MDRRQFLKMVSASVLAVTGMPSIVDARKKSNKPNILLIMADDMGYSDIGCYGGEINTPNLDSLAAGGMRFTQFYNCAKCSPTRASLLTGNYEHAVGVKNMEYGATFAEVLRPAGYRTIASGKWHQNPLPTTRGFDRYFGLADGCCNFWNPGTKARPGEGKPGRKRPAPRRWAIEGKAIMGYVPEQKDFYTTDAFTQYAIDRLDEYGNDDKPILLYLPFTAPHYPLHAWPDDIAKYRGKYMVGWDKIRETRYKRQIEIGMLDPKFGNSPRDEGVKKWDSLSKSKQDAEDLKMAVYAAMIERVDYGIGRVCAKLKEIGRWENTLILFLSDNGGCSETPDTTPNIPPGPLEGYRALGPPWANASNTPYRKYKSTDYEGGNCTPFIAHWPAVIKPGQITNQVGHIIDILPTFMDITGASYPEQIDGRKLKRPIGKSLLSIFKGKKRKPHDVLYWQFGKGKAIRIGDFKLVKYGNSDWELYDMANDRTELNNLAARFPEKAKEMSQMWEKWRANVGRKLE
ncbi:MAG: arylsulfatase [Planctomycetota bacterium]|jgi:arylsulfatase